MKKRTERIPQKCCLNCHFLLNTGLAGHPFPASQVDREALRKKITNSAPLNETKNFSIHTYYTCHKGIWVKIKISDFCELKKNRRTSCYFFPYKGEELHLSKADELERTEVDRRKQKQNLMLMLTAIVITLIAPIYKFLPDLARDIWRLLANLARSVWGK